MSALRRIVDVAVALLACLLATALLRWLTPAPTGYGLGAKLRHLEGHADGFELVFLGSSRVYRSFVPEVIDAELAARGHALRSFNLGVPGMGDFEADWLLRELLALEPARLRYVVLEPGLFRPQLLTPGRFSPRELEWHTARGTRAVLAAAGKSVAEAERDELVRAHLEHWVRRTLNLGQGRRLLTALFRGDPDLDSHGLTARVLSEDGGYLALEDSPGEEFARRRDAFLDDAAGHATRMARLTARRGLRPALDDYPLDLIEGQIAAVRAAGAEPVFVLPPASQVRAVAFSLRDAGHLPELLDFNAPQLYPELFTHESRFDRNHLSRDAARRFSALFAERFAGYLDARAE
ncbi:MAG: hypothetical protein AAF682_06435 [Planctomycetota bacterium]